MKRRVAAVCVLSFAVTGCDPQITRHNGGFLPDASAPMRVESPRLDASPPRSVPWPVLTLRGRAPSAARVIVEGAENPRVAEVLPDGTFCIDIPLAEVRDYSLSLLSHGAQGASSAPISVSTRFDPNAPPSAAVPTCNGADPRGCSTMVENCTNRIDDDCDGRIDAADDACSTCRDDLLEDNDGREGAPRISPGHYQNLMLCPGDEDFVGIYLREGDSVRAETDSNYDEVDLGIELFDPSGAVVASSDDDTGYESVQVTAAATGQYTVRIYALRGAAGYGLTLTASP